MNWYDQLTESVSSIYDNTVATGTDYFNTKINDYTTDPKPVKVVNTVQAPSQSLNASSGLFGFSWQTLAAIATVLGVIIVVVRR